MEKFEQDPVPKDISAEFLSMSRLAFREYLRTLKGEPALSIEVDWKDIWQARDLKSFLEDFSTKGPGQRRYASIRATKEEYQQEVNVFQSGVKWIEK